MAFVAAGGALGMWVGDPLTGGRPEGCGVEGCCPSPVFTVLFSPTSGEVVSVLFADLRCSSASPLLTCRSSPTIARFDNR